MSSHYLKDQYIVKRFPGAGFEVINLNSSPEPGVEIERHAKGTVNEEKLDRNIIRAKSRIKELALCNQWDWWCTFTIDKSKHDRYDLIGFQKDFASFLHDYNRRTPEENKVKYLLVPELHEDGAVHMHGFLRGIRPNDLYINEHGHLTWRSYEDHFGFISMDEIKDKKKASSYILKYMKKGMDLTVKELGAHLYYASKGLNKAETIFRGAASLDAEWDWKGDYCRKKWYDSIDDLKKDLETYGKEIDG